MEQWSIGFRGVLSVGFWSAGVRSSGEKFVSVREFDPSLVQLFHDPSPPSLHRSDTRDAKTPTLQHSNTPTLQYSNTPILHHSITPSLHHSVASSLRRFVASSLRRS